MQGRGSARARGSAPGGKVRTCSARGRPWSIWTWSAPYTVVCSVLSDGGTCGSGWPDVRLVQLTVVDLGAASSGRSSLVPLGFDTLTMLLRLRRRSFLGPIDDALDKVRTRGDALTASSLRGSGGWSSLCAEASGRRRKGFVRILSESRRRCVGIVGGEDGSTRVITMVGSSAFRVAALLQGRRAGFVCSVLRRQRGRERRKAARVRVVRAFEPDVDEDDRCARPCAQLQDRSAMSLTVMKHD